ncbi:PREDICTED: carbohydrate sulfotransferase 11-like [Galeopterus variegatus]|uniref:Carbohydrate sulfotransferase n=1 Tax=Galeopterus variegatus TaxID=482537 RepID=A0ABM0S2V8_GALVR|nr:PREDICTED: carbohydrate sulfotransferase 11-like [Galeopterus variegatus]
MTEITQVDQLKVPVGVADLEQTTWIPELDHQGQSGDTEKSSDFRGAQSSSQQVHSPPAPPASDFPGNPASHAMVESARVFSSAKAAAASRSPFLSEAESPSCLSLGRHLWADAKLCLLQLQLPPWDGGGRAGSAVPVPLVSPLQLELSNTAVLHQMRRDQVTDTCRANNAMSRKRRVLTPSDLKHLVVDEDHELIYCYVPKVACTNWKRLMMVLTGRGKYNDPMEIPANEAHVSANLKTLNQYSIPEINHRLKSYMKFLFVREPFERLVSAYRNKFTQKYNTSFHKRYGTKIIKRQRKNATQESLRKGDDVKFEEFVAYLIDPHTQREEPFNEHWQTVYSLCHPCHIHYDLVGKYETLEEDSNYVLQLAGVGSYLKFPTYAKSTRTTDEMTTEFFQNISSEHQTQLYEVYKLDFLMFNYSVPSYLKLE